MKIKVFPSSIGGSIVPPPSKSIMQRALAAALLHRGETIIYNPGEAADDIAASSIIEQLGASITRQASGSLCIQSHFPQWIPQEDPVLFCNESGLSLRMFTPIAGLLSRPVVVTGAGSLLHRPVMPIQKVLPALGVVCESANGVLPLRIRGPLQPVDIEIDAEGSSQFLTGLLMAFSAIHAKEKTITVKNMVSRPYVALTLDVMKAFKMMLPERGTGDSFYFSPDAALEMPPAKMEYTVAADWSSAAFLLVAGAVAGAVTLKGLDLFSVQGDKKILDALKDCGSILSIGADEVSVVKSAELQAFHFDATDCPDLFPPLVALAVHCSGNSVITGVHRLLHKESNRALALQSEFKKLGVAVTITGDELHIPGISAIQPGTVDSHNDHRIAMALSIAALTAKGPVVISNAEAIQKSYPHFYHDLCTLGAQIAPPF